MKNCWKQVVMFVLVAVAALWIGKTDVRAATIVETGSCGKNVTYTLDSDGVLTISGSGAIKSYAFQNYSSLTSVTILDGVTSIGSYAFSMCTSLTSITIPDSVTSIGTYAFWACSSLTSITIPDSVTSINHGMFSECSDLMSVTIPDSVTRIGEAAFRDCSSLKNITIPDSVTSIEDQAFMGCSSLTSITIPNSVTSIDPGGFYGCTALKKIEIATDNPVYDSRDNCNAIIETSTNSLIYGCQSTTIPDSVTGIGDWAFSGCSSLASITIPHGVTSIGEAAFAKCSGLASITISDSVIRIGDSAFASCTGLKNVTIQDGVISIGYMAFYECKSLKRITIPDSVSEIEEMALGYGDDKYWEPIKIDSFIIYGTKGSATETYAKENGFTFKKTGLTSKSTSVKLSKTSFNFDGKEKKPTVEVLDSKGKTLKKSNYTVTYSDNVKVGKATATITFKGKYSGTIKKTFTIKPAKTTITGTSRKSDSVTLTWKKQKKEANGYQIQYATDRKFTKNAKTVTLEGIKKSSKKISGLSEKTTYYFRVQTYKNVDGKQYYSGWSKTETVKAE